MLSEIDREMLDMTARLREKFPLKTIKLQYNCGVWSLEIGALDEEELWLLFSTMNRQPSEGELE